MSRLDEIKARRSAVHNAPWTFQPWGQNANQNGDYAESIVFDADGWEIAEGIADDVGEFIAHSPDDIDWLIAELENAQREDMSICEQEIEAAARAFVREFDDLDPWNKDHWIGRAEAALAAVYPLIVKRVAEDVAERLEATPDEFYPKACFIPLTDDDWAEVHEMFRARGRTLDAVSAEVMRIAYPAAAHVVREYVKEATDE